VTFLLLSVRFSFSTRAEAADSLTDWSRLCSVATSGSQPAAGWRNWLSLGATPSLS
jgi:hypothetical protein